MIRAGNIGKRLTRPVVLVGLMGSGKSRLGRMLANALDLPFVDTDDAITQAAGTTIPEIFENQGEPAFRDLEAGLIRRLMTEDKTVQVISTGGGAVMRAETATLVFDQALSIWTRADIPTLLDRVGRRGDRPLLKNHDPEKILRDMMVVRYPVYQRAHIVIDTDNGAPDQLLKTTLSRIEAALTP